jgi:hypothetical protein
VPDRVHPGPGRPHASHGTAIPPGPPDGGCWGSRRSPRPSCPMPRAPRMRGHQEMRTALASLCRYAAISAWAGVRTRRETTAAGTREGIPAGTAGSSPWRSTGGILRLFTSCSRRINGTPGTCAHSSSEGGPHVIHRLTGCPGSSRGGECPRRRLLPCRCRAIGGFPQHNRKEIRS